MPSRETLNFRSVRNCRNAVVMILDYVVDKYYIWAEIQISVSSACEGKDKVKEAN